MGKERYAYIILVGKPEGKRSLGKPRRRWLLLKKQDGKMRSAFIWLRILRYIWLFRTR
jgi:hypothetical protein